MKRQTKLWLDQIPDRTGRLEVMTLAFGLMVAFVYLYDRMGWLN